MQEEIRKRLEAKTVLLAPLQRHLTQLFNTENYFKPDEERSPNQQDKENFEFLTIIALSIQKLGLHIENVQERIEQKRQELKENLIEIGDIATAMQIDQIYSLYLFDVGQVEAAISIAEHITDGYPEPIIKNDGNMLQSIADAMGLIQFKKAKPAALVLIAEKFIQTGNLSRAAKLVESVNLQRYGLGYFSSLFEYHKKLRNTEGLETFITDLEERISKLDPDNDDLVIGFFSNFVTDAKELLFTQQEQTLPAEVRMQQTAEIENNTHRLDAQMKLMTDLVQKGEMKAVRELFCTIKKYVNTHVQTEDEDERETENWENPFSSIGTIAFKQQSKEDDDFISFYGRASLIIKLAEILITSPDLRDLFESCLKDIPRFIQMTSEKDQPYLWKSFLRIFSPSKEYSLLEKYYLEGEQLYPHFHDELKDTYASILSAFNPTQAIEVTRTIQNKRKKAQRLLKSIFRLFKSGQTFSLWETYVNELVTLENEILGKH